MSRLPISDIAEPQTTSLVGVLRRRAGLSAACSNDGSEGLAVTR